MEPRHEPQGAFRQDDGSVLWRVWAPAAADVRLVTWPGGCRQEMVMEAQEFGYHVCRQEGVEEGLRYAYQLADNAGRSAAPSYDDREYPDPASRWQPEGVHKPSAVFFPEAFAWSDENWRGVPRKELVIYELHVGTFTPAGTLEAIVPRLGELAELGVTALELMPLAQFPGERNWGYDGVHPYAVQNSYGGPRALQRLVDAAHGHGLAVILDVVYNHLGPEGNYFGQFGPYFTDHYRTPWGQAINFDAADSDPVRQFFIDNACWWVRDFHIDGLRLDAVHAIYDFSAQHILADIAEAVHAAVLPLPPGEGRGEGESYHVAPPPHPSPLPEGEGTSTPVRAVHVIAETHQNDVRLVRPAQVGGYALDGVWSDDFHHSVHSLLTGEIDGYYQDFGQPEHLAKAISDVFVYDGCYSSFRRRRHGNKVGDSDRSSFVVAIQNHDQVGNRALGDRLSTIISPAAQRLACGLLLLSPCVPLLFMGEEYGETRPFPFFCSFGDPDLIEAVRRGRKAEFAGLAFQWQSELPDPQDPATLAAAKLQWAWPEGSPQAQIRRLYRDLLAARRLWPAILEPVAMQVRLERIRAAGSGSDEVALLVVQQGSPRLTWIANLTPRAAPVPQLDDSQAELLLSTADVRYGGERPSCEPGDDLQPYELRVFGPRAWRL